MQTTVSPPRLHAGEVMADRAAAAVGRRREVHARHRDTGRPADLVALDGRENAA
jgi:hypothetical protein